MDWTLLNISWTLTALVGFLACAKNLYDAIRDNAAIPHSKIEGMSKTQAELVAGMAVLIHLSIAVALFFFLCLGVLAITTPPPSRILNDSVVIGFIVVQVMLTLTSIAGNFYRKRLMGKEV